MRDEASQRIGRYGVLGQLATGGMAEVLLGHLSGPSGFERPVVIKRILPHIASQGPFRNMFLDEARVASQIQHPNVVQYLELGEGDEGLFLVMEYLAGESLAAVRRRAYARGVPLPPEIVAHVIAEACAGLHAAHELVDADGVPQEIVHRDVSPDNLFITYEGAVKVIDFGIAKAANRLTSTETGVIKGKFEYMSPEQVRAEALDRRSDVFGLGIILHELLTGRRLFKRRNAAGTLRAILDEGAPDPRSMAPSCPRALAEVANKALARDPDGRFATAHEMRRALHAAASADGLPDEPLRALMHELFPDRIEAKRRMLRQMSEGEDEVSIPSADVDGDVELPLRTTQSAARSTRPRRAAVALLVAIPVAALLLAALGGVAWARSQRADLRATPVVAEVEAPPEIVSVLVESEPAAALYVGGEPRGTTPVELRLPRSTVALPGVLQAQAHEPLSLHIEPSRDQRLRLVLTPSAPPPPAATPSVAADPARRRSRPRRTVRPPRRRPAVEQASPGSDWDDTRF